MGRELRTKRESEKGAAGQAGMQGPRHALHRLNRYLRGEASGGYFCAGSPGQDGPST